MAIEYPRIGICNTRHIVRLPPQILLYKGFLYPLWAFCHPNWLLYDYGGLDIIEYPRIARDMQYMYIYMGFLYALDP